MTTKAPEKAKTKAEDETKPAPEEETTPGEGKPGEGPEEEKEPEQEGDKAPEEKPEGGQVALVVEDEGSKFRKLVEAHVSLAEMEADWSDMKEDLKAQAAEMKKKKTYINKLVSELSSGQVTFLPGTGAITPTPKRTKDKPEKKIKGVTMEMQGPAVGDKAKAEEPKKKAKAS